MSLVSLGLSAALAVTVLCSSNICPFSYNMHRIKADVQLFFGHFTGIRRHVAACSKHELDAAQICLSEIQS